MSARTDRELLELAAKAAGIAGEIKCITDGAMWLFRNDNAPPWNPLTDDGDALRLAVARNLTLYINHDDIDVVDYETVACCTETWAEHGGDKGAATRRAIVRAAAGDEP